MRKGIAILTEIILSVGIIAAGAIFFLVGYNFLNYQTQDAYKYTELQLLLDIGNRIDTASSNLGTTTIEYKMPFGVYNFKGENNVITLKTEGNPESSHIVLGLNLQDFEISDQDYICLYLENETGHIEPGECPNLNVSEDFCANLRCVDGVCTPNYGENCLSPDCACEDNICQPDYKKECLDSKGCVNENCVGILNYEDSCKYSWECGIFESNQMKCKPSKENISNKGCCPSGEIWDGTQCTIGCEGDPCDTNEECGTGAQCGISKNLECQPTQLNFTQYNNACCPSNWRWNGTECTEALTICDGPLPSRFDWRDRLGENWLPPVRDQEHCGSCWIFSAVGAVEGTYNIEQGTPGANNDISEQDLVSCGTGDGCIGGLPHIALRDFKNKGVCDETCFPYQDKNTGNHVKTRISCSLKCSDYQNRLWKIKDFTKIGKTLEEIKRALACYGPLSVGSGNWGHAIVLVGYNDITNNWVIRNSWGAGWGDGGYANIPYSGHKYSDIKNYAIYVEGVSSP